jgi:arylsulfatase
MLHRRQFLGAAAGGALGAALKRPNFVIILADDLGYGDLGCYGAPQIRTPRLDALAHRGMRMTDFSAQPICGPSRAALMTGCYPARVAERGNVKHLHPVLHQNEVTLADVLKSAGYATAMIGKWDLAGHVNQGFETDLMPQGQGFDMHFGTPTSNDSVQNTPLLRDNQVIEKPTDFGELTKRYTGESIRFIAENKDRPFFLYLAPNMPHTEIVASAGFRGRSKRGLYGDVVEELDFNAGRIVDALEQLKLDRNTYLLFASDNGPWLMRKEHGGSAGPLRSGKVSCWEGGFRVPAIFWAPGRVPAGRVCRDMMATIDVLPTFAALAGVPPPSGRVIDGLDCSNLLLDRRGVKSTREVFYYYLYKHLQAVRSGNWKLHLPRPAKPEWLRPLVDLPHIDDKDYLEIRQPMLFDLSRDIAEQHNVAAGNPQIVKRLLALAERARDDIGDYDRTGRNVRFFDPLEVRPKAPIRQFSPKKKGS